MSVESELPPRPAPPRRFGEVAVQWLTFVGVGRLVVVACAVAVVSAGGYWLVRSPALPPEATLPVAAAADSPASGDSPEATLPAPMSPEQPLTSSRTAATEPVAPVVVHVAGHVIAPGVYRLTGDARVHTAIEAAGGTTRDADLDGLNLAAPVVDGERVYVPVAGEVDPASVPARPVPGVATGGTDDATNRAGVPLDLNRASASEFESLPGVGPATAASIVDDRERNGPFATVDDLDRVPGIGPAKLAALRDLVSV